MNSCFLLKIGQGSDKMTFFLFCVYIEKGSCEVGNVNVLSRLTLSMFYTHISSINFVWAAKYVLFLKPKSFYLNTKNIDELNLHKYNFISI